MIFCPGGLVCHTGCSGHWFDHQHGHGFISKPRRTVGLHEAPRGLFPRWKKSFLFAENSCLHFFPSQHEVELCRKEQPYVIPVQTTDSGQGGNSEADSAGGGEYGTEALAPTSLQNFEPSTEQCFAQRAALLKSILNFLKKVIPDVTFTDSIRHRKSIHQVEFFSLK